jgi:hypothetical protein
MRALKSLMDEATESAPSQGVDLQRVLETGQRRVRRRRATGVVGAAVAVAVVAVGSLLVEGDTGERVLPADSTEPVGPVAVLADARRAVEGRDYSVLTTVTNENLDGENTLSYRAITQDGLVVVDEGPYSLDSRAGLLDPRTEEVQWLLGPGDDVPHGEYVGSSGRWIIWTTESGQFQDRPGFLLVDPTSGEQQVIDLVSLAGDERPLSFSEFPERSAPGADGRIYFSLDRDRSTADLLSVELDDPTDIRLEGVVGDFDVDGDLLTYTERTHEPTSTIHVRHLGTGEEASFDTQSGSRCDLHRLERTGDHIALFQGCGADAHGDSRVQVVTGSGEPVVTLRGSRLDGGTLTSRYLTTMVAFGKGAGAYVYDLETADLWRVSDGGVREPDLEGHDDLLTWQTPVNGERGMTFWAVEFGR